MLRVSAVKGIVVVSWRLYGKAREQNKVRKCRHIKLPEVGRGWKSGQMESSV